MYINVMVGSFRFFPPQNENDTTMFGNYRVVATVEKFYDILERIHSLENRHVGYKKTLVEVKHP